MTAGWRRRCGRCYPGPRRPGRARRRGLERAARRAAGADALHAPRIPGGAARLGQRRAGHRLGAALRHPAPRRRAARRLRGLPEEPLLRRVRLRLGLGRRLPAATACATTPSCWGRCPSRRCRARGCWRATTRRATRWWRRAPARRHGRLSSAHVLFVDEADRAAFERAGLAAAPGRAVPLDAGRGAAGGRLRRPAGACSATSARRSSRSGAASPRPASPSRVHEGAAIDEAAVGLLLPLLHAHLPARTTARPT